MEAGKRIDPSQNFGEGGKADEHVAKSLGMSREGAELQRIEAERAKKRQGTRTDLGPNLAQSYRTDEHVATELGMSTAQWKKLKTVFQKAQSGDLEAQELMKAEVISSLAVSPPRGH